MSQWTTLITNAPESVEMLLGTAGYRLLNTCLVTLVSAVIHSAGAPSAAFD